MMWEDKTTISKEIDLDKVCRSCLKESEDLIFMFDALGKCNDRPLYEMFATCTQLEIHKDDDMPRKMCCYCSQRVEEAYLFRLQAERCNNLLQKLIIKRANSFKEVHIKEEVVKEECSDFNDIHDPNYSDDSDDVQPLSSIKKSHLVLYNCKFCEFNTAVEDDVLNHLVVSHKTECGVSTTKGRGRPSQQELTDRKLNIQPSLNQFVSTTDCEAKLEVKIELDGNGTTCHIDQLDFNKLQGKSQFFKHQKTKISKRTKHPKNYICDVCGKNFYKSNQLSKHKFKHHNHTEQELKGSREKERKEKTFACGMCSKSFYKQEQLERHLKTHQPKEKKYHCPECPKQYDRQDKLKFHSRVHVANKSELESNFLCVYCGHGFSNSSNLVVHLRRHTGEKPYKCDVCQKGFPRSTDLINHKMVHTGERPCVCKSCGKAFSHQHKLIRHERIHTGHKPFKCNLCERAFTQSNDLTLHIRRHTGDKPYVCNVCGGRFYLNTVLQAHKRTNGHYDANEQATQLQQQQTNQQKNNLQSSIT